MKNTSKKKFGTWSIIWSEHSLFYGYGFRVWTKILSQQTDSKNKKVKRCKCTKDTCKVLEELASTI